jgi:hypothetical protein
MEAPWKFKDALPVSFLSNPFEDHLFYICNQWTEKDIGTGIHCLCFSEYFQHHQAAPILLTEPNFIFQNAVTQEKTVSKTKVMGSNHSHWPISQSTNSLAQQHEKTVMKTKVMVVLWPSDLLVVVNLKICAVHYCELSIWYLASSNISCHGDNCPFV